MEGKVIADFTSSVKTVKFVPITNSCSGYQLPWLSVILCFTVMSDDKIKQYLQLKQSLLLVCLLQVNSKGYFYD